jgi:hypothetical protein
MLSGFTIDVESTFYYQDDSYLLAWNVDRFIFFFEDLAKPDSFIV